MSFSTSSPKKIFPTVEFHSIAKYAFPIVGESFSSGGAISQARAEQLICHRLDVNARLGLHHRAADGFVHHPLPFRDPGGHQIAVHQRSSGGWSGKHYRAALVEECAECRAARWAWQAPAFDPTAPITRVNRRHITCDNSGRFQGFTRSQVSARWSDSVTDLRREIVALARAGEIAASFFATDMRWSALAPLYLGRGGAPVAAVLVADGLGLELVTVLTPADAICNVLGLGHALPTWLVPTTSATAA